MKRKLRSPNPPPHPSTSPGKLSSSSHRETVYNIYEIAAAAGVSIATISRVLNNRSNVSPDTRRTVLECMHRLGYIPTRGSIDRPPVIGVLLEYSSPTLTAYVAEVVGGISYFSDRNGLSLEILSLDQPRIRERGLTRYLREAGIDGAIVLLSNDKSDYIRHLEEERFPCIVMNNRVGEVVRFVDVDNAAGAEMALSHLTGLGHTRIAFIGGALANESLRTRFAVFRRWLESSKAEPADAYARIEPAAAGTNHLQEGYDKTRRLLEMSVPFTAIFCASDELAFGSMRALLDAGLRIPADVSVVGFDDCEMAAYVQPGLTTVRQPLRDMGTKAARVLVEMIEGYRRGGWAGLAGPTGIVETPRLVIRDSTGPAPGRPGHRSANGLEAR